VSRGSTTKKNTRRGRKIQQHNQPVNREKKKQASKKLRKTQPQNQPEKREAKLYNQPVNRGNTSAQ
jgi:hypothetical protein